MSRAIGNWLLIVIVAVVSIIVAALIISDITVKVTFNSNGGSSVSSQNVIKGKKIIEPEIPAGPDGLEFVGWFYNDVQWNFNEDTVKGDMELVARWNWDGKTANYDWFTKSEYEKTEDFYISNGAELYALAQLVREENSVNFEEKNIILTKDIYINGKEWTPIGTETIAFKGNIIGQNHKISGLTITDENQNITGWDAALFGSIEGSKTKAVVINDLIVENVNISLNKKDGSNYAGTAVAGIIKNVNVYNVIATGKINVNTNASTVAGMFLVNEDTVKMENVINNVEISGTRYNATTSASAYFILGGITGQIAGDGPFYYNNCVNNANIIMDNPFKDDLTENIGGYVPETIAGHIVGQTAAFSKLRVVFDNCTKSENALIYGSHLYKIVSDSNGYKFEFVNQAVMQGKRYIDETNTIDYGYTYITGDKDISFKYGNETIYFVPTDTVFNLDTINEDYKTKGTVGFVDKDNCFYSTKVATTEEDIRVVAGGKWLVSYSPGDHAIIYTFDK